MLKAKNDSFKSLSTVKKHGKTKKSSKKDATDAKALSRIKKPPFETLYAKHSH